MLSFPTSHSFDNDVDMEHGPASKKRKTASVIVDQPAESDKMVVDQVTDVSATFEEVWYYMYRIICTLKQTMHYTTTLTLLQIFPC